MKKPKKPCSYPGCPNLTDGQYCEKHRKLMDKRYDKYNRSPDHNTTYGRGWKRIRDLYLSQHPLCEECLKEGRYVPAEEVHHILPVLEGGTHNVNNLMSLCKSCHTKIHIKRGDRG